MGGLLGRLTGPVVMDESVKIFVDDAISTHKVVVFSKTYCPYCKKAKELLSKYPIKEDQLEVIELEKRPDCAQIQAYLKELTGASSVRRFPLALLLPFPFFLSPSLSLSPSFSL